MEEYIIIIAVLSIVAIIISSVSLIVGTMALAKIIGLKNSTHSVQMVPIDASVDEENEEYMKKWATSDKAIKKEMDMYQEDVEDNLGQFSETEEDKEIYSL